MGFLSKQAQKQADVVEGDWFPLPDDLDIYLITDPRPDLKEDHQLWEDLLLRATLHSEELAGHLHGLRGGGTRIRKAKGWYVLRPDIDPTGRVAWERKEDYEELRDKYLKPHLDVIVQLLKAMTKEENPHESRTA